MNIGLILNGCGAMDVFLSLKCSALNDTYVHIHYLCSFYTPKFVHHDFLRERG